MKFFSYEIQKEWAINVRQWGYTLGVWVMVATLISGGFALNEWRKVSVANRVVLEQDVLPAVKGIVSDLTDTTRTIKTVAGDFQVTAQNATQASAEFKDLASDLRNDYMPQITSDLHQTQTLLRQSVGSLTTEVQTQIHNNGEAVNQLINSTNGLIANDMSSLVKNITDIATELRGTSRQVRLLVEDPALAKTLQEVYGSSVALHGATSNVEVITGSMARMSQDLEAPVHKLTHPDPPKGFVGKMKFALSYLKDIGGVVYLVVKILNGF